MISAASASARYARRRSGRPLRRTDPEQGNQGGVGHRALRGHEAAVNTVTGNLAVGIAVPEQPRYRLLHNQYEKVLSKARCAVGRTSPALRSR